jgi:PAS domain S-box-containing protein
MNAAQMETSDVLNWLTRLGFRSNSTAGASGSNGENEAAAPKSRPSSPRTVQLYETSQRFSALVEHSPLAVIEWNPEHRITKWLGNSEALFGWRASEILGKRLDEFNFIHPDDLDAVRTALDALKNGKNSVVRNRNFRKDGSCVYCEWYNSAMIESPGGLVWGLSLALDVTGRHQTEEALREKSGGLSRSTTQFMT